jgi:hypothetical protein
MTIPELRAALEAANVRWALHRRSGDPTAAQDAWDDAEHLGLMLYRAEEAQRYEDMRRASEAGWDVLKGHPDHSGLSAAEQVVAQLDTYSQAEHAEGIAAARRRLATRRDARNARVKEAIARLEARDA